MYDLGVRSRELWADFEWTVFSAAAQKRLLDQLHAGRPRVVDLQIA